VITAERARDGSDEDADKKRNKKEKLIAVFRAASAASGETGAAGAVVAAATAPATAEPTTSSAITIMVAKAQTSSPSAVSRGGVEEGIQGDTVAKPSPSPSDTRMMVTPTAPTAPPKIAPHERLRHSRRRARER